MTFQGHSSSVLDCCFSPDGSMIASASSDHNLVLWNSKTGMLLKTLYGHSDEVKSCAFSRDGSKILSGSSDGTLRLWDIQSGTSIKTYTIDKGVPIEDSRLSRDGLIILAACNDGTLRLLDVASGSVMKTFTGHTKAVKRCRFSPDESIILSSSDDFTLKLWNVEKCEELFTLKGHTGWINACAFSPNGEYVVSGSFDKTLRVWEVKTGKEITFIQTSSFSNWINACTYSPDGSLIAFGCGSSIILWNPKTNEQLANIHNDDYNSLTFSQDGTQILTGCRDQTLKLWDVKTMRDLYLTHGTRDILSDKIFGFSPDGSMFITVESQFSLKLMESVTDAQYVIKLWDSTTRQVVKSLKQHSKDITCHDFSPDSTQLITGSLDKTVILWDIKSGTALHIITLAFRTREDYIRLCSFTPNGTQIITLSNQNILQFWDVKTGTELQSKMDLVRNCFPLISPDKTKILLIDSSRSYRLWDLTADTPSRKLENFYTDSMHYVYAFSPDSASFVTKIGKTDIKVWDAKSGAILQSFTPHFKDICTCAYHPQGIFVLTGSVDRTMNLWDAHTGASKQLFAGHFGAVTKCIFSPTGDLILSGAGDETLRVWETSTGKNIAIFPEARFVQALAMNERGLIILIDSSGLKMIELQNYEKWDD